MNTNNKQTETDPNEIGMIAACISDTVLKTLLDFAEERNLFGYIGALNEISEWAEEFYDQYYELTASWEDFENSDHNIYNSICWDDFVMDWSLDKLSKWMKEHNGTPGKPILSLDSKTPKLVIEIRGGTLTAVYSSIPVRYACIDYDNTPLNECPPIAFSESDTVAAQLHTIYADDKSPEQFIRTTLKENKF